MANLKTPTITTINNWGEVKQRLYFGDKEIVNASKRIQPNEGADSLQYITKDGVTKTFYFADDVTVVDAGKNREINKLRTDLFKMYLRHEVAKADFDRADAELIAQLQ